jgi:hypothetical protein
MPQRKVYHHFKYEETQDMHPNVRTNENENKSLRDPLLSGTNSRSQYDSLH